GIILLSLYTIASSLAILGDAPETIIGEDLTTLFGGFFLLFMGGLIFVGVIILFIGLGLWNLSRFSWALNLLAILLYVGFSLFSLPAVIDPLSNEILSLAFATFIGFYLFLIRSKFH
ncbi:MAG: hypothetical protein ACW98F_05760, partial [Candidatus Hodarchaeales archaeon]